MNSSFKKKSPLSILRMSVGVEKIAGIFQKVRSRGEKKPHKNIKREKRFH